MWEIWRFESLQARTMLNQKMLESAPFRMSIGSISVGCVWGHLSKPPRCPPLILCDLFVEVLTLALFFQSP
jgi:hypothetical protein